MKKQTHINYIISIFLVALSISCSQEVSNDKSNVINYKEFDDKIQIGGKKTAQLFQFRSSRDTIILCVEGTEIEFIFSESIKAENNSINVEIKEFYELNDMLLNNLSTEMDSGYIETGGMLHLSIRDSNNTELTADEVTCKIKFAGTEKKGMQLFTGVSQGYEVKWNSNSGYIIANENDTAEIRIQAEMIRNRKYFDVFKFGWINCDRFINIEQKENLTIKSSQKDLHNISVFVVLKSFSSILMSSFDKKKEVNFIGLPKNEIVTVIFLARKKDVLYYNIIDHKLNGEVLNFVDLKQSSEENFKSEIQSRFKESFVKLR
jgi:hypothetical protein